MVSKLVLAILDRAESLLNVQVSPYHCPVGQHGTDISVPQGQLVGADDRNNYNEMQVNNCSVLTVS